MAEDHTFQDLIAVTREVIAAFDQANERPWTVEVTMIELIKQVGDLAKRVMLLERYYLPDRERNPAYATSTADIGDELADILYCVIRVAEHYQIDLEASHLQARRREMCYVGLEPDF